MSHVNLPTFFQGLALETTTFTLNHVPSKSVQKTPYEMWTGKCPSMSFMKIWGCEAYVKCQMSTKLELKSRSASLWDILRKLKDIISSILSRIKCLLLGQKSSLKESLSLEKEKVEE
ncbi:uncharacterized mitochondrial protein AtMg00710-like [Gossypium raimondii]|uniref:uncharacterized mitochondrial protein AtMg00710-like n=1 Tax=Gossypium raimondii TaxID=29730 RepID=UPI00227A5F43|nr:uncharacterized mitochondrial protein AtMg00710-like [Gossypium raimondii]